MRQQLKHIHLFVLLVSLCTQGTLLGFQVHKETLIGSSKNLEIIDCFPIQTDSDIAIRVRFRNTGSIDFAPRVWAEIYTNGNVYHNRFISEVFVVPGTESTVDIPLTGLKLGQYKAIVAVKYFDESDVSGVKIATTLIDYVPKFTVSINRSKKITLIPSQENRPIAKIREAMPQTLLAQNDLVAKQPYFVAPNNSPGLNSKMTNKRPRKQTAPQKKEEVSSSITDLYIKKIAPEEIIAEYAVKKGDWLSKIALRYYGDMMKYNILFDANRDILKNADLIYPGQVLMIPALEQSEQIVAEVALQPANDYWTGLVFENSEKEKRLEKTEEVVLGDVAASGAQDLFFTSMISVPFSSNSYLISSIKEDKINMPRPLSFNRFSGANGSLTCSGLNPGPSSLMRTTSLFSSS